jgi:hypothetical protein
MHGQQNIKLVHIFTVFLLQQHADGGHSSDQNMSLKNNNTYMIEHIYKHAVVGLSYKYMCGSIIWYFVAIAMQRMDCEV